MRDSRNHNRRGVATVEAAVILPVIVLLLFGFVETGYFVNSQHTLHDAARQGARAAVHHGNSNAEVQAAVLRSLENSIEVNPEAVTVQLFKLTAEGTEEYQIQNLNENEQGEAVRVTVTVDYAQFRPPSDFLGMANRQIASAVVMQRRQ